MERKWKLGEDLSAEDNLLDGITFGEIITTLRCNCQFVTPDTLSKEVATIIEIRMQDMNYLLENNIDEIIEEAMKGRCWHEQTEKEKTWRGVRQVVRGLRNSGRSEKRRTGCL